MIFDIFQNALFTHDNFYNTFPTQLQAKLQQEFGSNQLCSFGNNGSQSRKKITSGKKGSKAGGGGNGVFGTGTEDMNKKVRNICLISTIELSKLRLSKLI